MGVMRVKPKPCPFQPTLPARGATAGTIPCSSSKDYFNPRSPHGERHSFHEVFFMLIIISTHAPRTGSDIFLSFPIVKGGENFNPRSPHGERPKECMKTRFWLNFNPRSPHGERPGSSVFADALFDFNPRSPHGERLVGIVATFASA